jgi:MFS family permease
MNLSSALQWSNRQVQVQALGRFLIQVSYGLLSFYIPLVFVNQVGLSATAVGFALSLCAITEVGGHILGATLADSPQFGRKVVLSLAAVSGVVVALILTVAQSIWLLMVASMVLGVSLGCYWTASGAAVMDATSSEDRSQAFAVMGVAEYIGIGLGVLGGSGLLAIVNQSPKLLFGGCGAMFVLFGLLTQTLMTNDYPSRGKHERWGRGWIAALQDKALVVFMLANVFFTTYVALVSSTIPLYFTNFLTGSDPMPGVSVGSTAGLFTGCYVGIGAVLQLPTTSMLTPLRRIFVLMGAMVLWAVGFTLLWAAGTLAEGQLIGAIVALCLLSLASVAYKPFFVATVSDLAPPDLRATYVAVSSQCWTLGYFIGPLLGGWAMDQSPLIAHRFWLAVAMSVAVCLALLWLFEVLHTRGAMASAEGESVV